ncbi:MAG: FISUMP domain-containing protein [Bacteroidales bacterium]
MVTGSITDILQTSAMGGGEVTDDGGSDVTVRGVCWSTWSEPNDQHAWTEDGSGVGSFTSDINGLEAGTTYYLRAYAKNTAGTGYGEIFSFSTLDESSLVDIDGNVYQTVQIGDQAWMAENLKVTRLNDGTQLTMGAYTDPSESPFEERVYQYVCYDLQESNCETYGALYRDDLVMQTNKLCPAGWHISTNVEWDRLIAHLGGDAVAGGKLKQEGYELWNTPNTGASDEVGFEALPGGAFVMNVATVTLEFRYMHTQSWFWSPGGTEFYSGADYEAARVLNHDSGDIRRFNSYIYQSMENQNSLYVRCVRD